MSYYGGPPAPAYGQQPYGQPAPYNNGPFPMAAPPPNPPPPLPAGWHQQWEPNCRQAFWVEDATGRAQWEPPYSGGGYARGAPPPGDYYQSGGPPPNYGGNYSGGGNYQQQDSGGGSSGTGKLIMAGIGGAALGAFAEHEIGMFSFFFFGAGVVRPC